MKDVGWSNAPISPDCLCKCHSSREIRYNQNPNQTVLNGVLTPCDTLWTLMQSGLNLIMQLYWMHGRWSLRVFFSPITDKLCIRNRDFRKHLLHPFQMGLQRRILHLFGCCCCCWFCFPVATIIEKTNGSTNPVKNCHPNLLKWPSSHKSLRAQS